VVSITPRPPLPPGKEPPGTHCTGGWVDPRAGLEAEVRGKILCLCRGSNPGRPVCSETLYRLSYPGSPCVLHTSKLAPVRSHLVLPAPAPAPTRRTIRPDSIDQPHRSVSPPHDRDRLHQHRSGATLCPPALLST
jgi:hypothetical protein